MLIAAEIWKEHPRSFEIFRTQLQQQLFQGVGPGHFEASHPALPKPSGSPGAYLLKSKLLNRGGRFKCLSRHPHVLRGTLVLAVHIVARLNFWSHDSCAAPIRGTMLFVSKNGLLQLPPPSMGQGGSIRHGAQSEKPLRNPKRWARADGLANSAL